MKSPGLIALLRWLKWMLWDRNRCKHEPEPEWRMRDFGVGKALYCRKCGKCLDLV